MKKQLYRSHRMFGFERARAVAPDGTELVILETSPHKLEASPAHLLMPVSDQEAAFEVTMALAAAVERARFLGVDMDVLRAAFAKAVDEQ
jgi:hypothetical protein